MRIFMTFLFTLLSLPHLQFSGNSATIDVTASLVSLGSPYVTSAYSRNIWDMQVFNNRIYLANGDSVANEKSEGVVYYDLASNKFINQFSVDDEQLGDYKIINGELYVPGADATESWEFGNFYKLTGDSWTKNRTIPKAVHVTGIEEFGGYLFTGIGSTENKVMLMSSDKGKKWKPIDKSTLLKYSPNNGRPILSMFKLNGNLYGASMLHGYALDNNNVVRVSKVTKNGITSFSSSVVVANKMFPGAPLDQSNKFVKATPFGTMLLYIGASVAPSDSAVVRTLYVATDINVAKCITLPDTLAKPMDIIIKSNTAHILTYKKIAANSFINIVYSTSDGVAFNETLRFSSDTFARSFEEVNGCFYFGLGCASDSISESSGKVLKVDISH